MKLSTPSPNRAADLSYGPGVWIPARCRPDALMTRIDKTARVVCCVALVFAAQFLAEAQNNFSDAEADGVKAFLRDNFRQTNACMVIGLADQSGNRIFSAGKLDNGTDRDVNGDTLFEIGSVTKTF